MTRRVRIDARLLPEEADELDDFERIEPPKFDARAHHRSPKGVRMSKDKDKPAPRKRRRVVIDVR